MPNYAIKRDLRANTAFLFHTGRVGPLFWLLDAMNMIFAIVAYRCEIDGIRTESIDIQVISFSQTDKATILHSLSSAAPHAYLNDKGETVTWYFAELLDLSYPDKLTDGQEIAGFIIECADFHKLSGAGI